MSEFKKGDAFMLTKQEYWNNLGDLMEKQGMPPELALMLRNLVDAHLNGRVGPRATPELIAQAKEWLLKGFWLDHESLDILVLVPDDKSTGCPHFQTVTRSIFGRFKWLAEV